MQQQEQQLMKAPATRSIYLGLIIGWYAVFPLMGDEAIVSSAPDQKTLATTVVEFARPFDFAYLDWKEKTTVEQGIAYLRGDTNQGGIGINLQRQFAEFADQSPTLLIRLEPQNQARRLRLFFYDADGTAYEYVFDLPVDAPASPTVTDTSAGDSWRTLFPATGSTLMEPDRIAAAGKVQGLDFQRIVQIQLQGDWQKQRVAVAIKQIGLQSADPELRAKFRAMESAKAADREKAAAELAKKRKQQQTQVDHQPGNPRVLAVSPITNRILAITIQEREVQRVPQQPYTAMPTDQVQWKGAEVLAWRQGQITLSRQHAFIFRSTTAGQTIQLGDFASQAGFLHPPEPIIGKRLTDLTLTEVDSYTIISTEDDQYRLPTQPLSVSRKSKPNDLAFGHDGIELAVYHRLYLHLPQPLREGHSYTIHFRHINTDCSQIDYRHDTRQVVNEAIHMTQLGYHPHDPYKRAFLSAWLGTGGAVSWSDFEPSGVASVNGTAATVTSFRFHLLEIQKNTTVYEGDVQRAFSGVSPEPSFREGRNYSKTDVAYCDFSAFQQPGIYRLWIPGVGCSHPFPLNDDVWKEAFRTSMQGLLHHRSGLELGPPFTAYRRPRPMHPQDGFRVYPLTSTRLAGEAAVVQQELQQRWQADGKLGEPVAEAWGGYMDAGDWDRRSQHLRVSWLLSELYELAAAKLDHFPLRLPAAEADNQIPDLLDEVRWNLDCYHRLQRPDGGVAGGIESTAHPSHGEASWQETLLVGVFAPDPVSSASFAATAAKLARQLIDLEPQASEMYRQAAERAYQWALANAPTVLATLPMEQQKKAQTEWENARLLAAVELAWTTNQSTYLQALSQWLPNSSTVWHPDFCFTYSRLPAHLADAALQQQARSTLLQQAASALQFADGNNFGLTSSNKHLPPMGYVGYFSVPEMVTQVLPRAHALTGDTKYLAGAVRACQFSTGANPENRCYTTGVGWNPPRNPLHIDSRVSGQAAPVGITIYGQSDPAERYGYDEWVHRWYLHPAMVPNSYAWPAAEAHVDLPNWPACSEYTVHQTIGPTTYYWGYLAFCR